MSGEVGPAGTSTKADCGASCGRFCGDAKSVAFVSGSTGNHGAPTGPVNRQNRQCDSVWQHQVRSIRTVYIQTAQKTVDSVSASEFNVPEGPTWTSGVHRDKESLPNAEVHKPDWNTSARAHDAVAEFPQILARGSEL